MKNEYLQCKNNLNIRINNYRHENNIKKLELTTKDPHIQELIDSVGLLQGAMEYEIFQLGNELYKTLLSNMNICTYLPAKVLSTGVIVGPMQTQLISKGTMVKMDNIYLKTLNDSIIVNHNLLSSKIVENNGEFFLELLLDKPYNVSKTMEFLLDEYLIRAMFYNNIEIKAMVFNRPNYFTECDCRLINGGSLQEYLQFPEQFFKIRLDNINSAGISSNFTIMIPLNTNKFLNTSNIVINPIIMENLYEKSTIVDVKSMGDYVLDMESQNIISVKEVRLNSEVTIPNVITNEDGWYLLENNSMHFQRGYDSPLQVSCNVTDKNIIIDYDQKLIFDVFNGINFKEILYYARAKNINEYNNIAQILRTLYSYNIDEIFNYYIRHYNLEITITQYSHKIIPIINHNYLIQSVVNVITMKTEESPMVLLALFNEITEKFPIELHCHGSYGELILK